MENPNKMLFDCQQMFRHACSFAEVADMALEKFRHETADIGWYVTPATVNSAFACEVFLKALLQFYDIKFEKLLRGKKRHEIKELYGLLPNDTKTWIKKTTMIIDGGRWDKALGYDLLDDISNAFIEWRYSYEHDWSKSCVMHIDFGFLTAFRNALREACCQLFFGMSWETYRA